jgi:hypothetical protein
LHLGCQSGIAFKGILLKYMEFQRKGCRLSGRVLTSHVCAWGPTPKNTHTYTHTHTHTSRGRERSLLPIKVSSNQKVPRREQVSIKQTPIPELLPQTTCAILQKYLLEKTASAPSLSFYFYCRLPLQAAYQRQAPANGN